jgi:Transposase, Mutator family
VGELYGIEISPDLVSAVTDSALEDVGAWQSRGLEATYAIVFFDLDESPALASPIPLAPSWSCTVSVIPVFLLPVLAKMMVHLGV